MNKGHNEPLRKSECKHIQIFIIYTLYKSFTDKVTVNKKGQDRNGKWTEPRMK